MAESVRDLLDQTKPTVDEKTRLRVLKERQNEERQRKLEEIKAQALAAQRFKEQKEQERRKRLEELRVKDEAKRQQVEERKKAINEAEKNRLEFILKKNQEREQRLDLKKRNERSNPVFAFGSSTPRMLEPVDFTVSFWGHRKATSIQNISSTSASASSSLTRRQSERDLDVANKKRATSATGLERSAENNIPSIPAGCASGYLGRRRTDLVPTIPTRDCSFTSSRKSLNHSPGRAYSMTRLDQLAKPRRRPDLPSLDESNSFYSSPLSSSRVLSVTRSMSHLAVGKLKPSPTTKGLDKADRRSMNQLAGDGAHLAPRTTRTIQLREQKLHMSSNPIDASSRPSSSLSQQSTNSITSATSVRHRISATPRKPRPVSIAVTGITYDVKFEKRNEMKPPLPKTRKSVNKEVAALKTKIKSPIDNKREVVEIKEVVNDKRVMHESHKVGEITDEEQKKPTDVNLNVKTQFQSSIAETSEFLKTEKKSNEHVPESKSSDEEVLSANVKTDGSQIKINEPEMVEVKVEPISETKKGIETKQQPTEKPIEPIEPKTIVKTPADVNSENKESNMNTEMTASMIKRINTEEEAKAAIAEKRRLIREEAERQAELERIRLEEEARAELERQQKEEEQVRQLIEIQRQTEQERLKEAIKEAQRREEEERLKKEEEQKLKQLKEEAERKAREDAERQKAELQERLKNEEKEREARRKRVEAIMLRTRGKNNANLSTQSTDEKNENKADDQGRDDQENKVNGAKIIDRENGMTKNGKETEIVDNIIQSEIVKNANSIDTISSTDTLNSNNSWRESQQFDSLM